MKTVYETIWSIVGAALLLWFAAAYITTCQHPPMHDGVIMPAAVPHQKQSIEEFLKDHPDIKKRVDELNRQAESDERYGRS